MRFVRIIYIIHFVPGSLLTNLANMNCVAMLYKVSCLVLALANQNAALQFAYCCVATCLLACDTLHNIAVESRHSHTIADLAQPRNGFNVTRPFPVRGLGLGMSLQ